MIQVQAVAKNIAAMPSSAAEWNSTCTKEGALKAFYTGPIHEFLTIDDLLKGVNVIIISVNLQCLISMYKIQALVK